MKDKKVQALVAKAKGNKKAFARLCELKVNEVIFLCVREMGSFEDGQDAAQEVFIQMQKSLPGLEAPEAFNVWLNRLVYNTCSRIKRKAVRHREVLNAQEFEDFLMDETLASLPQESVEETEDKLQIIGIIDKLPGKYRSCVVMHYYQNLSYTQIADILGITTGAVNNNLRMARKYIRRELEATETPVPVQAQAMVPGVLLADALRETASSINPAVARQCLVAAGSAGGWALAHGVALGVTTKAAIAAFTTVTFAATVGAGVYLSTPSVSSPAEPATPYTLSSPQSSGVKQEAGSAGEDTALLSGHVLAGSVALAPGPDTDPEALLGLDGVVLQLVDTQTEEVIAVATSENGLFRLEGVPEGTYQLWIQPPFQAAPAQNSPIDLTEDWLALIEGSEEIRLEGSGAILEGLDILLEPQMSLTGQVSLGLPDGAALPDDVLPSLLVELYDPQGRLVATTGLQPNGSYLFEKPAISQTGLYTLRVISVREDVVLNIPDEQIALEPGKTNATMERNT